MAEMEMYDYLSTVASDVDVTLSIPAQEVIVDEGEKNQEVLEADDGTEEIITVSNTSVFYVTLLFNRKTPSDIGTIYDIYHDTAKANGIANSFKWENLEDGHTYVVRFRTTLKRSARAVTHGLDRILLKVIGRIAD